MTRHEPKLLHRGLLAVRRNTIRRLLRSTFGIEQLRDGQQRIIDSVLDGKDTLGSTGGLIQPTSPLTPRVSGRSSALASATRLGSEYHCGDERLKRLA